MFINGNIGAFLGSMKRTVSRNKGFTVVEVLVAVGIMGIVSLGIAEMFRQMAEQQRNVVQLMNKQDLKSMTTIATRDKGGCTNTLGGILIPTTVGGAVNVPNGVRDNQNNRIVSYTVNPPTSPTKVGNAAGDWLVVTSIQFYSTTPNIPNQRKAAMIRIKYDRARATGTVNEGMDIPISVVPNGAGRVSLCYGYDFTDDNICNTNGGVFNPATGNCDYTKLCAGGYCLNSASGLCANGNCTTTFATQQCPLPGQPPTWRTMVGIKNGIIQCGPMDNKPWP